MSAGVLVFGAVALWTVTATPRYRSSALLRIESSSTTAPLLDDLKSIPGASLMGLGNDDVDTEIGILKSRRVADAALDSMALMVQVAPASVPRHALLAVALVDTTAWPSGTLTFTKTTDGFSVAAEGFDAPPPIPATLKAGDTLQLGALRLQLTARDSVTPPQFRARILPRYKAQRLLDERLTIRTQEGGSRLVQVTYEDPDRELAAAVVRQLLDRYIGYTLGNTATDDGRRLGELRRETAAAAATLATAEESLRRFKEQRRLVVPDEQATGQLKRISAAQTALDALGVEREALARLLTLVNSRARGGREPNAYRQLATFPSLITNRAIQDMLGTMMTLESKRSELMVRRTAGNDEVSEVTQRIAELESQLQRTGSQYLESLDQQIGVATQSIKAMTADLDAFPRQEMEFVRLYRDRTLLAEGYAMLQKQLKQMELQTAMRADRIRVVDAPRVSEADDPAFPRVTVQLALGAVLAIAVALLVAFGRALVTAASDTGSQASTTASQNVGSGSAV
jgi:uncharacterized protein involved in exopolysaccharide biosynthesis